MRWQPIIALSVVSAVAQLSIVASANVSEAQLRAVYFAGQTLTAIDVGLTKDQQKVLKKLTQNRRAVKPDAIYLSNTGNWLIIDNVIGKHEYITYALILDNKHNIVAVEVMEYRESYGGQVQGAAWRKQFVGKTASSQLTLGRDISNISGATLSSKNLTDGVKRLVHMVKLIAN